MCVCESVCYHAAVCLHMQACQLVEAVVSVCETMQHDGVGTPAWYTVFVCMVV